MWLAATIKCIPRVHFDNYLWASCASLTQSQPFLNRVDCFDVEAILSLYSPSAYGTLLSVTWVWVWICCSLAHTSIGIWIYLCVLVHMWGGWSREDWWCNFGYVIKNLVLSGINAGCLFLLCENIELQLLRPTYWTNKHAWYDTILHTIVI